MNMRRIRKEVRYATRGLVSPLIAGLTRPPQYDVSNTLVISGFPRSGTTWLAEVVNTVPGTGLVFEPLNHLTVKAARAAGCDWDNFHPPGEAWPSGRQFIGEVLAGRVLNRWTASRLPVNRAAHVSRWIVKFVRANQMLAWMVSHFPIPAPVFLIRHPCAVYASWTERGWPVVDYPPRLDNPFFAAFPSMRSAILGLAHPEEFFAVQWCMQHFTALSQIDPSRVQVCFYEHLVTNGPSEVRRVLGRWNLSLPDALDKSLSRPSSKAGAGVQAGAIRQIDTWQHKLHPAAIDRIVGVLARFGLDFYGRHADPDPGRLWSTRGHPAIGPAPKES